ncbi:hypothetical protein THAOC_14743 [Thalassiosira oceanica]|uniref:Uncharacterized protein n=1 Tax=Thalassiosira oceanica TaxID=159749 RepID=K0SU26_THAOC|nr:hypothetical protein THAOC_14743 [Thalassiosira oceanica]|eukprot:EJK64516.1 hypothetical protein THAOC_14743 [Thalassiosira oceanica]
MKLLLSAAILAASHAQDDCPFCPDGLEVGTDVQILDPEAEGFTCGLVVDYAASLSDRGIFETDCPIVTAWMGECCPDHYAAMIGGVEVEAEAEPTEAIIIVDKDEKQEEDYLPEEATGEPAEPETAAAAPEPASIIARPESCGEKVYSCLVSAEPDQECAEAIHEECMDTSSGCLDDASSIVGSRDLVCGAAECLILGNPEPICRCEFVINECVNTHLNNILSGEEVTSESGAALVGDGSGVSDRVCVESACCATSESVEGKAKCFGSGYADEFVSGGKRLESAKRRAEAQAARAAAARMSKARVSVAQQVKAAARRAKAPAARSGESLPMRTESTRPTRRLVRNQPRRRPPKDLATRRCPPTPGPTATRAPMSRPPRMTSPTRRRTGTVAAGTAVSKDPSGGSGAPRHGALVLTAAAVALTVSSLA